MFESDVLLYWIIPFLIFLARVADVSMGTIRIIFISRGWKLVAASIGFIEVLIWVVAMGQIIQNLDNVWAYLAYAAGFSVGTFVGMVIEEKIAVGTVLFQIITKKSAKKLIKELRESKDRLTSVPAFGDEGKVHILYVVTKRKRAKKVYNLIKEHHPTAFLCVEDIRVVQNSLPYVENVASSDAKHSPGRKVMNHTKRHVLKKK